MSPFIHVIVLLITMGSLHGVVLSYILGRGKLFDKKSNLYLSIFILAFSLSNMHYVARIFRVFEQYSWLSYLTFPWTFLIPIAFYLFIVYLLNPEFQLKKAGAWLFLPFILQFSFHITLFLFDFFNTSISEQYLDLILFIDLKLETVLSLFMTLLFIPIVLIKLSNYESKLKENYSEISHRSIAWLRQLVLALIGIWILWAIPALYQVFTGITTPTLDLILWLLMSACIYCIGYATYFRRDIFFAERLFPSDSELAYVKTAPENFEFKKNQGTQSTKVKSKIQELTTKNEIPNTTVQIDKFEQQYKRMIKIIEEEKFYTDPDFSLSLLSEKCSLSANYLSQIINKHTGGNFYSLINNYRVEEAKRLIGSKEFEHYTLTSIGLEAGFKSKSSFYRIFKEKTKQTPSQIRKALKNN